MQLKPDVILLDITMPGINGLEASSRMSAMGLASPILIFTMHDSRELARDARRVGAKGFVTKSDAARHLVAAIEKLLSGGTFFGRPDAPPKPEGNPAPMISFRLGLAFS